MVMTKIATVLIAVLLATGCAACAHAQEPIPPAWRNPTITNNPSLTVSRASSVAVTIAENGEVRIDWELVETLAKEPGALRDGAAIARALIAVRDGTWKPLK